MAVRQTRQIFSVETSPHRFPQSVTETVDMMCTNPQIAVRKGYITRHCCLLAAMLILDHLSSVTSGTANVGKKYIPRRCLHYIARSSFCPEARMSKASIVVALFALVKLMTAGILAHFLRLECDDFWVSKHMPTRTC